MLEVLAPQRGILTCRAVMTSEMSMNSAPEPNAQVKRRGLLRFGTIITAFTGASAISLFQGSSAQAGPGDKNPSVNYVPISEKGVASGVATLDIESKVPQAQLPDLSAAFASLPNNGKRAVGQGELMTSVREYGATGNGTSDDTASIKAAWSASGGNIYFPEGTYVFNGPSLGTTGITRPVVRGAGIARTLIMLGAGIRLIDTAAGILNLTLENLMTRGGAGVFRSTRTSGSVCGTYVVRDCEFEGYTAAAIESNSSDMPYWKISRTYFEGANQTTSIGVALSGLSDGTIIEGCAFVKNRIHAKLRDGGNNAHIANCDFIRFTGSEGLPRIDIWIVPRSAAVNSGAGFTIKESKLGSENLHPTDKRVVYADESGGETNAERFPVLDTASSGYITGHEIAGVMLGGATGAAHPLVYSTTPNIRASRYMNITLQGSKPAHIVQFLNAPGASIYNSGNVIGPVTGEDLGVDFVQPPEPSNASGVFSLNDPNHVWGGKHIQRATAASGDPVGYKSIFRSTDTPLTAQGGASIALVTDAHGGTDAFQGNFPVGAAVLQSQFSSGVITPGAPAWIEFDAKSGTLAEGLLSLHYSGKSKVHFSRSFTMGTEWVRYCFPWTPREAMAGFYLTFEKSAGLAGSFSVGRTRIYHSREPLNVDGVILLNGVKYRLSVSGGAITATKV